ncbi:M20 family metallopeptidase [Fodinicurvata sp. EGI_FJ10296]|uniref:M20 metallopeptidase family protein n=1 Tax=Fodinicurvata sp. EGI_FJ10296 TaxID=3231908 RepID=UPI003455E10F
MTQGPTTGATPADIHAIVDEIAPALIDIRRTLHANPELGFQEYETSRLVQSELTKIGIDHRNGFGETGVAGLVGSGDGKTVGIRGDMDALPIEESESPAYASRNKGVMHACGHDAHTAILLGVATVLARLKNDLPGRAMVIFQPAEEGLGGARAMLESGLFDWVKPDAMLGYHNWPLIAPGSVGWHPKTAFASTDPFDITITGRSGHGAHPHMTIDPIVAASSLIGDLQTIVSRRVAPLDAAVVSIGRIEGGTARNQIPDTVRLEGTMRAQTTAVRDTVRSAIKNICRATEEGYGVTCDLAFLQGVPPVVNDPACLGPVLEEARRMLGNENVVELPQGSMGSEDFAEFSTRIPAAHLRIGSKRADRDTMLHRSNFDLDELCIPTAVKVLSAAAIRMMTRT